LIDTGSPLHYGFAVSSIGYIFIPISIGLERFTNYGNMSMVLLLSLVDSGLSFVNGLDGVELIRVLLYGAYMPYIFGITVTTLKQKSLWSWLGYAMVPIGFFTGAFSFINLWLMDRKSTPTVLIREICFLVVVVLLFLYPLILTIRKNCCEKKNYISV